MRRFRYKDIEVYDNYKRNALSKIIQILKKRKDIVVTKVVSMSMQKKELEDKLDEQHENIIIWWCLCDYFSKHEDPNTLLNHEKTKLIPLMEKIRNYTVKNMDTVKIKRNALTYFLKEKYDYLEKPSNLKPIICGKFYEEKIDEKYLDEVINNFIDGIDDLIEVLSNTKISISNYVKKYFGK